MALSQLLTSICLTLLAYGAFKLFRFLYSEFITSPLRYLPGPKSSSIIYGNLKDIYQAENSVLHEKWVAEYGNTIKYKGLAGMNRLFTMDTKAINHVLMNSNIYQKPSAVRYNLGRILGHGLLIVEDDKHKQQRKIMNPAFGAAQIRDLTEIFVEKSILLRNIWASEIAKEGEVRRIDVLSWLSKMTLDVIGMAGFNYKFDALDGTKKNELNEAFSKIFSASAKFSILPFIRAMFPILRFIPLERDAEAKSARNTMDRIGNELLRNSKAAIFDANGMEVEKSSLRGRDLLSLLIRANLAKDLPESQRMNDEDVLAQVPTFLVAGHETTSTATTWALYALTQSPDVQVKLREELLKVSTDNPTMDELNGLPYLDAVVRETLRVHAPVASTIRVAVKDDILPLSTPVVCTNGKTEHYLRVKKGQTIFVPILALNRAKRIWGEDSFEFKPERWFSVPEAASSVPGVWGNLLTFLGGPRACIGYRFSVVEMKALLFTLVRAFEFELAVPPEDIGKKTAIVQRPIVKSEPGNNHMPLLIRPFHRS